MWAKGKQASQVCLEGSRPSLLDVACADARIASCVSTTPLGLMRGTGGGDDERVTLFDRKTTGERVLFAVGGDDAGRLERVENGESRRGR